MNELTKEELHRLARLGAQARLDELQREEAAIRAAFPDLFRAKPGRKAGAKSAAVATADAAAADAATAAAPVKKRKGGMSPEARKVQGERMRKYWAERRKAKGEAAPKAKSAKGNSKTKA